MNRPIEKNRPLAQPARSGNCAKMVKIFKNIKASYNLIKSGDKDLFEDLFEFFSNHFLEVVKIKLGKLIRILQNRNVTQEID
jgi:hypothetical protein